MKVHCDNCNAAYDVDESRIPASGMAVKCAKCQQLFVVKPSVKAEPEIVEPVALTPEEEEWPEPEKPRGFILRRPDGKTYPFEEMAVLQRWVVERKALKRDELSDDGGQNWRKLDQVSELESFFAVVESSMSSANIPAQQENKQEQPKEERPRMTMQMWAQPAAPANPPSEQRATQEIVASEGIETTQESKPAMPKAIPEDPKPEQKETLPSDEDFEDTRITSLPEKPQPVEEKPTPTPAPALQPEEQTAQEQNLSAAPPTPATPTPSTQAVMSANRDNTWKTDEFDAAQWDTLADDDTDIGGGKKKLVIGIVLALLIAAAAVVMFVPQVKDAVFGKEVSPETLASIEQTRAVMGLYSDQALEEAVVKVKALVEANPEISEVFALASEVYTSQADLWGYRLNAAEKIQQAKHKILQELKKKYEKSEKKKEKDEILAQMEEVNKTLLEANKNVAGAASKINGPIGQAEPLVTRAFELDPESAIVNRAIADFYRIGTKPGKANEHVEKALKLDPENANAHYIKGALLASDPALLAEALQSLKTAIEKDEGLLKARFRMADLHINNNQAEEGRKILESILAANVDHKLAKEMLNRLKPAQPEVKEEQAKVEEKPKVHKPATYEEFMRRGDSLRNSDNPKAALGSYKSAWKMKETVEAANGLGFCYYDLFNFKKSATYFKKAVAKSSRNQAAVIGMAMTYDKLKKKSKAVEYYKIYLRYHPKGQDAPFARNALERLQ